MRNFLILNIALENQFCLPQRLSHTSCVEHALKIQKDTNPKLQYQIRHRAKLF